MPPRTQSDLSPDEKSVMRDPAVAKRCNQSAFVIRTENAIGSNVLFKAPTHYEFYFEKMEKSVDHSNGVSNVHILMRIHKFETNKRIYRQKELLIWLKHVSR